MSQPLNKIKELICSLPKKDIPIAEDFLNNRKFNSLMELIDSDIYLIRRDQRKEDPKEEYIDIDLNNIILLKGELTQYMSYLFPEDLVNDLDDIYE